MLQGNPAICKYSHRHLQTHKFPGGDACLCIQPRTVIHEIALVVQVRLSETHSFPMPDTVLAKHFFWTQVVPLGTGLLTPSKQPLLDRSSAAVGGTRLPALGLLCPEFIGVHSCATEPGTCMNWKGTQGHVSSACKLSTVVPGVLTVLSYGGSWKGQGREGPASLWFLVPRSLCCAAGLCAPSGCGNPENVTFSFKLICKHFCLRTIVNPQAW